MRLLRGEVYFVDLDPIQGHEQGGRRPVVVVSRDALNSLPLVVLVVPGTTRVRSPIPPVANVFVPAGEGGLRYDTLFMPLHTRALDHHRFTEPPIGRLSPATLEKIESAFTWTLNIKMP